MIPRTFVAGLHLRWDGVRQRPHHLLSRIAKHVPVVVIEEPLAAAQDRDDVRVEGAVTIVRPLRRSGWAPRVDDDTIATVRRIVGNEPAGVWLYTPMMLTLADAFGGVPLVYDLMDELAQFAFAPPEMKDAQDRAAERADLVFTGGRSLYAAHASLGAKVRCEPSGVELERFAASVAPHPLPAALPRGPVFGYSGVIDERLDLELIAALADAFPDGHVVLVGPVVKIDPLALPRRSNVHLPGPVPYDALPSWLAGFDVALMPFARNAATQFISPTKTLEYFAAGLPVVSTPIPDVVAEFGDTVLIGDDTPGFIAQARAALAPGPARLARGRAYAAARTWDAIAQRMFDALASL